MSAVSWSGRREKICAGQYLRALHFVQYLLVLTAILVLEGPVVCVGTSPVGPRFSVKLHLHVIVIVEDCKGCSTHRQGAANEEPVGVVL